MSIHLLFIEQLSFGEKLLFIAALFVTALIIARASTKKEEKEEEDLGEPMYEEPDILGLERKVSNSTIRIPHSINPGPILIIAIFLIILYLIFFPIPL